MRYKHYGIWHAYTWKDYYLDVKCLALGLSALGFEQGDKLLIVGDNAPQWYAAELAAQAGHGASLGVDPDLTPDEIAAIARDVQSAVCGCPGSGAGRQAPGGRETGSRAL